MYSNLKIFKGTDFLLNSSVDSNGVLDVSVFMEEVSTGLYESVNIFILESVLLNNTTYLNKPISETANVSSFQFEWKEDVYESTDIIMYGAKVENGITKIDVKETQSIEALDNSIIVGTSNDTKVVSSLDNEAIQINVAISSVDEGRHQRTLLVSSNDGVNKTLIARILFYGEVVGEDERLKLLLQNLGATLEDGDFILFKEHDITEMAPDYILLNQKRRELLLELSNIKPFVGTYKAILNAIDFFGYNNLTLKEYWLNVNTGSNSFGKLHAIPVPNSSKYGEAVRKKLPIQVPSSNLKKTSRFSLVYKINVPNGGVDVWDIPTVDEIFDFTPEEVLIKLYGLKRKLQKEYLPLNAKIVDIVGEGDFFMQKNLNVWNNQNAIAFFTEGIDINYKSEPQNRSLFIEDVSLILKKVYDPNDLVNGGYNDYHTVLNTDFSDYDLLSSSYRDDIINAIELFYETYYEQDLDTFNEDIPVGCPIVLNGEETFTRTWNDAEFTWNDAVDPNASLLITWDNWWKRWVYEIEWIVTGPREYSESFKGSIDDFLKFPVFLPYEGSYDVEMRTYDLFGHMSRDLKRNYINVNQKSVEFYGFYKTLRKNTWNDRKEIKWNDVGGYWDLPLHNPNKIDESFASWYIGLDRANYPHDFTGPEDANFSTVTRYLDIYSDTGYSETVGPYHWNNCDFSWNWTEELWWNSTRIGPDLTASFIIEEIQNLSILEITHTNPSTNELESGSIEIQSATPTSNTDISGWQLVVDELNNSNDPIISKFVYNLVGQETSNPADGIVDVVAYVLAVGKEYSRVYDFDTVSISNGKISGEVHQVTYNPNYDEIDIFSDWREINRSTHVTFCPEYSKMPGMKLRKWTITNNTYPDNSDIYYGDMVLTYLFKYPGEYTISLEVEDTNGNINTSHKNILKVN